MQQCVLRSMQQAVSKYVLQTQPASPESSAPAPSSGLICSCALGHCLHLPQTLTILTTHGLPVCFPVLLSFICSFLNRLLERSVISTRKYINRASCAVQTTLHWLLIQQLFTMITASLSMPNRLCKIRFRAPWKASSFPQAIVVGLLVLEWCLVYSSPSQGACLFGAQCGSL